MTRRPLHAVGEAPPPDPPDLPPAAPPPEEDLPPQPLRSHSLASAVRAIQEDMRGCVGGKLAWNEMFCAPTVDGVPLTDSDISDIRERMETRIIIGYDRSQQPKGLCIGKDMAHEAVDVVAKRNLKYHPVRQYLDSLHWDGTERIEQAAVDIFKGADTPINRILIKRWFISAVARALKPGCKVDTVLVLIGGQGYFKSTLFRTLASPQYFIDTAIDIHSKDAFGTCRRAWIIEFAELESINRGRDSNAKKSFISSPTDNYRPPYARRDITEPRSFLFVGTTNPEDGFLADSTGERRWWPFDVTAHCDIEAAAALRDQLWAEAVHLYRARIPWWLTPTEEDLLKPAHEKHSVVDAWEELVLDGVRRAGFAGLSLSTADILRDVIKMDPGHWNRSHENRIGAIMRRAGYSNARAAGSAKNAPRAWVKL